MDDSARQQIPPLSKYRFLAGLQCHKRLYLECFHRDLADPTGTGLQAILDTGIKVGKLARDLYPEGVLVEGEHLNHEDAVALTEKALSAASIPAIYEAAFTYDGVRIHADILARAGDDVFDLIEVKSGTRVREGQLFDVAIQLYVLKGCGISVGRSCLAHLNTEYVHQGDGYDLGQLFCVKDVTDSVEEFLSNIPSALDKMRLPLWGLEPPDVAAQKQCSKPYICPFYSHCHTGETEHSLARLPGASQELLRELEEAGVGGIREIPADFQGLTPIQRRARDCVVNSRVYLDPLLERELGQLEYPIHFLDFETFSPALPLYAGTHPYQVMPFQWSDHIMEAGGEVGHKEFLHEAFQDPREPFATSLLETLGTGGSIVAYSRYEATRIRELAIDLPHLASDLLALLEGRIVDLLILVRRYCYHPEFHGSFSLKSVLPALVPEFSYSGLEISSGLLASAAYAELISPETSPERRDFLRRSLLEYCERDTEAMVQLFKALKESHHAGSDL